MRDQNLYELLQVSENADQEIIQAAYRRLILRYHPDRSSEPNAAEMTQRLNDAYTVLSDPVRRAEYDRERRGRTSSSSSGTGQTSSGTSQNKPPPPPRPPPPPPQRPRASQPPPTSSPWKIVGVLGGALILVIIVWSVSSGGSDDDNSTGRINLTDVWGTARPGNFVPLPTARPTNPPIPSTVWPTPTATVIVSTPTFTPTPVSIPTPTTTPAPIPNLSGTTWDFVSGDSLTSWGWQFLDDGKIGLSYVPISLWTTTTDFRETGITWIQDGTTIRILYEDGSAIYSGTLSGDRMSGNATSYSSNPWTWTATKTLPPSATLPGTTWKFINRPDSGQRLSWLYEFFNEGRGLCTIDQTSLLSMQVCIWDEMEKYEISWSQNGEIFRLDKWLITGSSGQAPLETYLGTRTGNSMSGTASNTGGEFWTWTATRLK